MCRLSSLEKELLKKYKNIYSENHPPKWAYDLKPPIVFVGDRYTEKKAKVLVYASAENLNAAMQQDDDHPNHKDLKKRENVDNQWIRHRFFYDNFKKEKDNTFIGIMPIDNKSLLLITKYILDRLGYGQFFSNDLTDLLNEISVGNFCKFSIEDKKNIDYARDYNKLKYSISYVTADIQTLNPNIVILPQTIHNSIGSDLNRCLSKKKVIKIYQITPLVINVQIAKYLKVNNLHINPRIKEMAVHYDIKGIQLDKYLQWLHSTWEDRIG